MKYIFVPEKLLPDGVGFRLYGRAHLIWLAVLTVMCIIMVVSYKKMNAKNRRTFARAVAVGLLVSEVIRDTLIIILKGWKWSYLPLHPCSFTMYIIAIWAFKPNKVCGQILYGFGIAGALMALIFCNWTTQPPLQFQSVHSFIFHGVLIGFILMVIIGGDIRPERIGALYCIVFLTAGAAFTAIFNYTLPDCNFFFTREGSEGSPLEIFIKLFGSPWWLFAYGALVVVVMTAEFLPWKPQRLKEEKA